MFKIVGKYKDPKAKPWTEVNPEKERIQLWDLIKQNDKIKGMEEIGDGSSYFENPIEFKEFRKLA